MEIKVLGTGCSSCKALYAHTEQALTELNCEATLIKEEDLLRIMTYNILSLPALVIDEKVVSSGKRLSVAEIKELIKREFDISTSLLNMSMSQPEHVLQHKKAENIGENL